MNLVQDILNFWFQGISDQTLIKKNQPPFSTWFTKNVDFDNTIKIKFEETLKAGLAGKLLDWETTHHGCLALILLFDQFTRNIYRDTPQMYLADSLSLNLNLRCIDQQWDQSLLYIERVFLYMPLMHAEDLTMQEKSVESFTKLHDAVYEKYPLNSSYYFYNLTFAKRHHEIIKRFGRFPHRNKILNRPSCGEEIAFLTQPNSKF